MDKTALVREVANLFRLGGHKVDTSVDINHSEIDVVAEELQGLVRKKILIECTEERTVGIRKFRGDLQKLQSAQQHLGASAIIMHVALHGYSKEALGLAQDTRIDIYTLSELTARLVNFDAYMAAIEGDPTRAVILEEYQPTALHYEADPTTKRPALDFLSRWLASPSKWLTVLGDYGVGKSWTLKRFLYSLLDEYKENTHAHPLPFFLYRCNALRRLSIFKTFC
ncbi:MAG: hypothetical protein ACLQIB_42465 [Isosphaeraceae bacterium]